MGSRVTWVLLVGVAVVMGAVSVDALDVKNQEKFGVIHPPMHEAILRSSIIRLSEDPNQSPNAKDMWEKLVTESKTIVDLILWGTDWDKMETGLRWNDMPDEKVTTGSDHTTLLLGNLFMLGWQLGVQNQDIGKGRMQDEPIAKRSHYLDLQYFHSMKPCIEPVMFNTSQTEEKTVSAEKIRRLREKQAASASDTSSSDTSSSDTSSSDTSSSDTVSEDVSSDEADMDAVFSSFLETKAKAKAMSRTRYDATYECADMTNRQVKDLIMRQAMEWWMKSCTDSYVPQMGFLGTSLGSQDEEKKMRGDLMKAAMEILNEKLLDTREVVLFPGAFYEGYTDSTARAPPFFIGNLLHMVQDSYSGAHCRRLHAELLPQDAPLAENKIIFFQGYDAQSAKLHAVADRQGPGGSVSDKWDQRPGAWQASLASERVLDIYGKYYQYDSSEETVNEGKDKCVQGALEIFDFLDKEVYPLALPNTLAGGSDPAYHLRHMHCPGEELVVPGAGPGGEDLKVRRCLGSSTIDMGGVPIRGPDDQCYIEESGACEASGWVGCEDDASDCTPSTSDPCQGKCVCGKKKILAKLIWSPTRDCVCVEVDENGSPKEIMPLVCGIAEEEE